MLSSISALALFASALLDSEPQAFCVGGSERIFYPHAMVAVAVGRVPVPVIAIALHKAAKSASA